MIKLPPRFDEIRPYYEEDRARKITTPLLRHIIATTITRTTNRVYKGNAPLKCMQSAAGIQHLLARVGIESKMIAGAVCFAKVDAVTREVMGWSGFWNKDHHVWIVTGFEELVDISIAFLNDHPLTKGEELAPPALWWPGSLGQPHFFRYLSDVRVDTQEFSGEEALLFSKFMEELDRDFDRICANLNPAEFHFAGLLGGEGELSRLLDERHPYLMVAVNQTPSILELPKWIVERQKEMEVAYKRGVSPKSWLMDIEGLFKTQESS